MTPVRKEKVQKERTLKTLFAERRSHPDVIKGPKKRFLQRIQCRLTRRNLRCLLIQGHSFRKTKQCWRNLFVCVRVPQESFLSVGTTHKKAILFVCRSHRFPFLLNLWSSSTIPDSLSRAGAYPSIPLLLLGAWFFLLRLFCVVLIFVQFNVPKVVCKVFVFMGDWRLPFLPENKKQVCTETMSDQLQGSIILYRNQGARQLKNRNQ